MSDPQQDNEGEERPGTEPQGEMSGRRYQLTHDYLVPSLREWLTRKQKDLLEEFSNEVASGGSRHSPQSHSWMDGVKKFFDSLAG